MSVFNSWYIARARKFATKATRSDKGTILLEVDVYDGLKIDATPEQWNAMIGAVTPHLAGAAKPKQKPVDEEPEY